MRNFWISWEHRSDYGDFVLPSPWWVSGGGNDGLENQFDSICAAVRAEDEDDAKRIIIKSFDSVPPMDNFKWRFVDEKPENWSPFSDRFPRDQWMSW